MNQNNPRTKAMYTKLTDYKTVQEFAKTYVNKEGKRGVSRNYIFLLIKQEKEYPNTTGIDVLEIDERFFVRMSAKRLKKSEIERVKSK